MIIIDEAQLIPGKATFEELRLLTNFQLDDRNLLSLVLIGQTELRERLKKKPYRALRQRIGMQYHLGPLDAEEAEAYVRHRLRGRRQVRRRCSMDEALALLFEHSGGIPRRINTIAGNALVEGFGRSAAIIGPEIIESVVNDGV